MRYLIVSIVLLILVACGPPPAKVPTTEEGVALEARELVRLSLTERLLENTLSYYRNQASSMVAGQKGIPVKEAEVLIDAELKSLVEVEHNRLIDALAPIYMRYYTPAEIHELLSFYQTEVARKSLRVSSQIAAESQQYVRLWSENFGMQLMEKMKLEP